MLSYGGAYKENACRAGVKVEEVIVVNRKSTLSPSNKQLLCKKVSKPVWTYAFRISLGLH